MKKTKKRSLAYVLAVLVALGILVNGWVHRDEIFSGYEQGFEQVK